VTAPFWVVLKALILFTVMVLIRGAYPRLTIDRVLDLGWRYLIPLSLINLLIVASILELQNFLYNLGW
jgi:NADH:ubiquinone oxidoreductase subunit H